MFHVILVLMSQHPGWVDPSDKEAVIPTKKNTKKNDNDGWEPTLRIINTNPKNQRLDSPEKGR